MNLNLDSDRKLTELDITIIFYLVAVRAEIVVDKCSQLNDCNTCTQKGCNWCFKGNYNHIIFEIVSLRLDL
jgi:hypothetical protein